MSTTTIRPPKAHEVQGLQRFLATALPGVTAPGLLFLHHHAGSCQVAINDQGELLAAVVTWRSPGEYSTAIIEWLALRPGTESMTLEDTIRHCLLYWQQQCCRHVYLCASQGGSQHLSLLEGMGFKATNVGDAPSFYFSLLPERICLQHKKMRPRMNSVNGQISEETLFEYFQDGQMVWGTYAGGDVARGILLGQMNANRDIRFHYMQMDTQGQLFQGTSKSTSELLNDGRVVLYENWEWTGNRTGSGSSIIEEIK